jgi:hypothetical protein
MTNETIIKILFKLFKLIEGRLPKNVCKVLGTGCLAGAVFSALCLPGENTARALFCLVVCLLLDCFFWSMSLMYEEVHAE